MTGYAIVFALGFLVGWKRDLLRRFALWAFDQTLGRRVGRLMQ